MNFTLILQSLTEKQRKTLYYALEHGISQYVVYNSTRFIGVFADHISNLQIDETQGSWSIGTILPTAVPS